jgi:hypothetical protein
VIGLHNSSLTISQEWLEMAIRDLDGFLEIFPDHDHAQKLRESR